MFTNKSYTKSLILSLITSLFVILSPILCLSEDFESTLKEKVDKIHDLFSPSILSFEGGNAVCIDDNIALAPSTLFESEKRFIAMDSKLKISLLKINGNYKKLSFEEPKKNSNIFFLLQSDFSTNKLNILLVSGRIENNSLLLDGRYSLGSLLVSPDLKPIGIVVQNFPDKSNVLIVKIHENEIRKLIKRKPGWLGIQAQTVSEELSKLLFTKKGVIVTNVYQEGPAFKSGIRRGDVIIEADSFLIKDLKDLQNLLSTKFSGEEIVLKIQRGNEQTTTVVILEEPPEKLISESEIKSIPGVEITEIPQSVQQSLREKVKGVFVSRVSENSPALGIIKEGDIIVEVNKREVANLQDFNNIISNYYSNDLLLLLYRKNNFQYVILPSQKFR